MLFRSVLCVLASFVSVLGECKDGCNEPTLFYEGLNCKPKYTSPNDCCPSEYDCSNIEQKAATNEDKCYFHGKTYSVGEDINDDETYGNCEIGCHCRKLKNGNMTFTCAILDCPEWLGLRPGPGCTLKYELNKCCNVGMACEPYNVTCKVGTESFHEGQRFSAPEAKCTNCICQEGFKGKYEAPFCTKETCIDEARRQNQVYSFCAPTFIKLSDCCPFYWICPGQDDKIVASTTSKNSDLKCKFGDKTLNIGDKFERTSGEKGKVSCECRIPPYLTCIQNYEYST